MKAMVSLVALTSFFVSSVIAPVFAANSARGEERQAFAKTTIVSLAKQATALKGQSTDTVDAWIAEQTEELQAVADEHLMPRREVATLVEQFAAFKGLSGDEAAERLEHASLALQQKGLLHDIFNTAGYVTGIAALLIASPIGQSIGKEFGIGMGPRIIASFSAIGLTILFWNLSNGAFAHS